MDGGCHVSVSEPLLRSAAPRPPRQRAVGGNQNRTGVMLESPWGRHEPIGQGADPDVPVHVVGPGSASLHRDELYPPTDQLP